MPVCVEIRRGPRISDFRIVNVANVRPRHYRKLRSAVSNAVVNPKYQPAANATPAESTVQNAISIRIRCREIIALLAIKYAPKFPARAAIARGRRRPSSRACRWVKDRQSCKRSNFLALTLAIFCDRFVQIRRRYVACADSVISHQLMLRDHHYPPVDRPRS